MVSLSLKRRRLLNFINAYIIMQSLFAHIMLSLEFSIFPKEIEMLTNTCFFFLRVNILREHYKIFVPKNEYTYVIT